MAIADHSLAFEPTDPDAFEGKVNGYWSTDGLDRHPERSRGIP